jgi:hypothetical protein
MPPPVRQTKTISRLIYGHYRSRDRVYINVIGINQLIVNILTKNVPHAGDENTVLVVLLKQIARASGRLFNQNILVLSFPVLWPLESCQIP